MMSFRTERSEVRNLKIKIKPFIPLQRNKDYFIYRFLPSVEMTYFESMININLYDFRNAFGLPKISLMTKYFFNAATSFGMTRFTFAF